jgi:hypothetical protein
LLLALCVSASAADMTAFGLKLGEPFTIPECERMSYGYSLSTKALCYQKSEYPFKKRDKKTPPPPLVTDFVSLMFPVREIPDVVAGLDVQALVIDGRLESVAFSTLGITNQERILGKLKEKYGEPTLLQPEKVQNRMGAQYETFTATWKFPNLNITFEGVQSTLDNGVVRIDTDKGREHRENILNQLRKDARPL